HLDGEHRDPGSKWGIFAKQGQHGGHLAPSQVPPSYFGDNPHQKLTLKVMKPSEKADFCRSWSTASEDEDE
ncbi:hypothetical protein Anapl_10346, partial [Anas platyrhynchos]